MKVDRLLSRFRSFKDYLGDPIGRGGSIYRGRFALKGRNVEGWARRCDSSMPRPPDSVTVTYSGEVIGTIREFTGGPPEYRFVLDAGFDITASDVLQERFRVFAVNSIGQQFAIQADGRMQADYIRETRVAEPDIELTIEFSQDGNAGPYLRDGWCNREPKFTRTLGKASFMEIPVNEPHTNYHIEMHLMPFIVPGRLPSQGLDVYVNDYLVSRSNLRDIDKTVTLEVPQYLLVEQAIKLRFDFPDASRPSDLNPDSKDKRVLAITFKKMVLSRQSDA
jgi:hypothetical protein